MREHQQGGNSEERIQRCEAFFEMGTSEFPTQALSQAQTSALQTSARFEDKTPVQARVQLPSAQVRPLGLIYLILFFKALVPPFLHNKLLTQLSLPLLGASFSAYSGI